MRGFRKSKHLKVRWIRFIGIPLLIWALFVVFVTVIEPWIFAIDEPLSSQAITAANVDNLQVLMTWEGQDDGPTTATFNTDSTLLALALNDGKIRIHTVETLELQTSLDGAATDTVDLQFSQNGSRLAAQDRNLNYYFWNMESGELIGEYLRQPDEIWLQVDAYIRNIVVMDSAGNVSVQDAINFSELFSIQLAETLPRPKINPDGTMLLTQDSNELLAWDIYSGEILYQFEKPIDAPLVGFGFSPDGSLIWASWRIWELERERSEDDTITRLWQSTNGELAAELLGGGTHYRAFFSVENRLMATAGEDNNLQNALWVWDVNAQELLGEAGIPTGGGLADFNPAGDLLAVVSGTGTSLQFWDKNTPEKPVSILFQIGGSDRPPMFSTDGRYLLTDGTDIRLWGIP